MEGEMKFRLIIDKSKEEEIVVTAHERSALTDKIELLIMQYDGADKIPAFLDDEMKLLKFTQIECIAVIDGKTCAIDSEGNQYRLKMRLYELEEKLPSYFIRVNKSAIANEKRIEKFCSTYTGAVNVLFKCGYSEFVSRRCFAEIKRRYK